MNWEELRFTQKYQGVADFRVKSEEECLTKIRKLLSFLPSNHEERPPAIKPTDDPERMTNALADIVPTDFNRSYNMHKVIKEIVDDGDFLEVKAEFAPEIIVGFGRLDGHHPVGIIANQPMVRAGSVFAWPTAAYAVMGPKEIVELFCTDLYKNPPNPDEAKARLDRRVSRRLR